jgi:putative SOS response-associated peptidase YedK
MCGRFTLTLDAHQLQAAFPWVIMPEEGDVTARYNIAPTQPVAAIPNEEPYRLDHFYWGLVPSWSKDVAIGSRLINARSETLAEKPSFRAAYRRRRCLIPADGFYEWQSLPGRKNKQPVLIRMRSQEVFCLAGLWEIWQSPEGSELRSCTILTTRPNELVAPIHDRMPVILPAAAYRTWLSPNEETPAALQGLLEPYPAAEMALHPVSAAVNNPAHDAPDCVLPLEEKWF